MVIYSEILGQPFKTVEECLAAEKEYTLLLKEKEERERKEREQREQDVRSTYKALINAWVNYEKALERAGYSIDSLEEKALVFVEVIDDAETRKNQSSKS